LTVQNSYDQFPLQRTSSKRERIELAPQVSSIFAEQVVRVHCAMPHISLSVYSLTKFCKLYRMSYFCCIQTPVSFLLNLERRRNFASCKRTSQIVQLLPKPRTLNKSCEKAIVNKNLSLE